MPNYREDVVRAATAAESESSSTLGSAPSLRDGWWPFVPFPFVVNDSIDSCPAPWPLEETSATPPLFA